MKKNKIVYNVEKNHLMSFVDFAEYLGKTPPFAKKLFEFILKQVSREMFVNDKGEILPVFYGPNENLKAKNCFIDKRAISYFIKKYATELENLGVNGDYLKMLIYDIPRVTSGDKNILNLWNVLAKISPNTKCVSDLCRYAKENFISAEYSVMTPSGYFKTEKVFVFVKGKAGRFGLAIRKDAYPYFMRTYQEDLKKEALRLDANTMEMGLRALLRELNVTENKDLILKEFIINNCLNDMFKVKNEEGEEEELPCFTYKKNGYLSIDKRALGTFVLKHQKALASMGFKSFQHIIADVPKLVDAKKFFSLHSLSELLRSSVLKEKLRDFLDKNGVNFFKITSPEGKEISCFEEYFCHGKKRYYLPKENLVPFLNTYSKELEHFGVRKEFIDDRSGAKKIVYKEPQMLLLEDFYNALATDARFHKELSEKIKTLFRSEKFEYLDEYGVLHSEPMFLKVRSGIGIATVFSHEKAMKSFISKYRDLLQQSGIKKEAIEHFLGERKIINYSDGYVPIYDFPKVFHQSKKNISKIVREKYLDETYPAFNEAGQLVHKPMFVPMQHNFKGIIFYAMPKEALVVFARRHQKELHISDIVIEELAGNIKVINKTDNYISLPDLFRGISKNSRNSIEKAHKFIIQNCMDDMYVTKNEVGTIITKPIFMYTRDKSSGNVSLCVDVNGVDTFFKHRKAELKECGLYPFPIYERVQKSKISIKNLIIDKLKTLGRI